MARTTRLDRILVVVSYVLLVGVVAFLSWDIDRRLAAAQDSRCKLDDAVVSAVAVQMVNDIERAAQQGDPYPKDSLTSAETVIERVAGVLTKECVDAGVDIEVNVPPDFDLDGDGQ